MILSQPYQKRPIRFLQIEEINGWRVKVYGISAISERPPQQMVESAKALAFQRLPVPPVQTGTLQEKRLISEDRYGVAILIVHEGRDGIFALVSWWMGENMLQNHVYFSPSVPPFEFEYISPSGITACVWEMAVLSFEREAWIEHILANESGPDIENYFSCQLNADV